MPGVRVPVQPLCREKASVLLLDTPVTLARVLPLMLSQERLTKLSQGKAAALRFATNSRFPRIVVPTHQVGSDQRPYHAGILRRSRAACPFAQIGQERQLFLRQIHEGRVPQLT